ncbi:MAG: hypothetical protein ACI837_002147, partial [Crocinitomicaceae bacterium]
MVKSQKINKGVSYSALFLAFCIFFESTAMGLRTFVNADENQAFSYSAYDGPKPAIDSVKIVDQPAIGENSIDGLVSPPDGGPDQPEVQSFTPIGTSDMVDPFSGDFSYNIPLMDVDGYPINIAYSAGITPDQEASWVGLGWNLNPGVVNRAMRGLPDDFNGTEKIEKKMNLKKNWTVGGSVGADVELFGFGGSGGLSVNATLGVNYNNYNGFGASFSFGADAAFSQSNGGLEGSLGLGFSGNSQGGATVTPRAGLSIRSKNNSSVKNKLNLAAPINSRSGFTNMSMSYTRAKDKSAKFTKTGKALDKTIRGMTGMGLGRPGATSKLPMSSSFNIGMSSYTPQITMPMNSGGGTFSFKLGGDLFGLDASGTFTGFYNSQWLKTTYEAVPAYGYMNLGSGQNISNAMLDFNRENDGTFTKNTPALPIPSLTYDLFSVSGQGVGGSYRPVRKEIGHVFDRKMRNSSVNGSLGLEANLGLIFKGGLDLNVTYSTSTSGDWNDGGNKAHNAVKYSNNELFFREANEMSVDADPDFFNNLGGNMPVNFEVMSHRRIDNQLLDIYGDPIPVTNYSKEGTDKRNQVVYTLTNAEMRYKVGIQDIHPQAYGSTHLEVD